MLHDSLPPPAQTVLFQDALRRDPTTARRTALLAVLLDERYLTREQLIARVELELGKNCFGRSAWEDNFYRDIRVVKQALQAAGFHLAFSRGEQRAGYYLQNQPPLSDELSGLIRGACDEVDIRQIEIYHRLSPANRFRQGCAASDAARNGMAYRIRLENPELSLAEANRLALQQAYEP